jgi:protein transport protein SEC20
VNASSDVTLALRRTHDMMASELSRSQFAHDTLKESTAALAQLGETYSIMDTMLSSSRNLLGTLLRSQKSDTWYLETAFYVLAATICWLVFRRFLYGPLWWFVWFPVRIFFRSLIGVLTGIGLLGGKAAETAISVTSVVASSSATPTVVHNKATRASRPNAPPRVSVNVGGGGRGGPMDPATTKGQDGETLSERVGHIIEESQYTGEPDYGDEPEEQIAAEEQIDAQKNPKKRMWEEEKETAKVVPLAKDEL